LSKQFDFPVKNIISKENALDGLRYVIFYWSSTLSFDIMPAESFNRVVCDKLCAKNFSRTFNSMSLVTNTLESYQLQKAQNSIKPSPRHSKSNKADLKTANIHS
jgi:hypothetical protein